MKTAQEDREIEQGNKAAGSFLSRVRAATVHSARLALGATAFLVMTSLFARLHWRFELACHFLPLYLAASLACAPLLAFTRRWRWLLASLVVVAITLPEVLPYLIPIEENGPTQQRELRVLFANVHSANQNYAALLDLIEAEQPDIVALAEINNEWARSLESLQRLYSYQLVEPREDNFGIAIFSRLTMKAEVITFDADIRLPSILAEISQADDGRTLQILVTHPVPPVSRQYTSSRDQQLDSIAEYLRSTDDAVLVVGDLNVTPWSPRFKDFCSQAQLLDSRRGRGIQGTWPSTWFRPMRLPLDHVLLRGDIEVLSLRLGRNIGSDHLPVIADVRL